MILIDTHCHLCHGRLSRQIEDVLARATEAGVSKIICPTSDGDEAEAAMRLMELHDNIYFTAGAHPHGAKEVDQSYFDAIKRWAQVPRFVAIGEIGLDYHYNYSPPDRQREVFARQLDLAAELDLPIVIHTREAFADTMEVLASSGCNGRRVVFHSFTGPPGETEQALELGATISFSGIVTFKRAEELRASAALVPDDRLLIETDGPFLSPEPVRKLKTNEPASVAHVANCLANVRSTQPKDIAKLTTDNAIRFFGLDA